MPSNEDYLDNLLKDMNEADKKNNAALSDETLDPDTIADMSGEEMDQLLTVQIYRNLM